MGEQSVTHVNYAINIFLGQFFRVDALRVDSTIAGP